MKAVIILPTYNERENIGKVLKKISEAANNLPQKYQVETLVVDDHSPDGTAEEVRKFMKTYPGLTLISGEKKGLGMAYVRGMNYAVYKMKADVVFEMDADLSHDPNLIPHFLKEIDEGSDFVIGSRYIRGGSIPQEWAFHRKIFSFFGNLIVRFGLFIPSIHDWTSGYRAIRASVFQTVGGGLSKFPGYAFQVAFLHRVHQHKFVVTEIPLVFIDRSWGKSKIIPPDYIYNVLLYVFSYSTMWRYLVVGGIGFSIQAAVAHLLVRMRLFPGAAVTIAAEIAIISNFILNNGWTFRQKKLSGRRRILKRFTAFNIASLGSILIQGAIVSLGVILFGHSSWFIFMILAIIFFVIPYSFFVYNRYIWRTHEH